jgi:hypothetical protein
MWLVHAATIDKQISVFFMVKVLFNCIVIIIVIVIVIRNVDELQYKQCIATSQTTATTNNMTGALAKMSIGCNNT